MASPAPPFFHDQKTSFTSYPCVALNRSRPIIVAAASIATLAGGMAFAARHLNPYRPQLVRLSVPLPAAHAHLAGLRIAFVTDTHLGPSITERNLIRATTLLTAERPDLVLLGGDYISESPRHARPAAAILGRLAVSAPLGGFAVLGNHDLANDAGKVTAALEAEGIMVLRNRATPVSTASGVLWIAGIDEAILSRPDLEETFASIPQGSAVLALWHEPDGAARAAALGAFLQLSGHSHGGQVRLPGLGALAAPPGGRHFVAGLNHAGGMPVYTSRGVGVYRPPVRLNCPPEVTLVTLTRRTNRS